MTQYFFYSSFWSLKIFLEAVKAVIKWFQISKRRMVKKLSLHFWGRYPAGIYWFNINNENTGATSEICSKWTIKTPERRQWCSGVFIVNFEEISDIVLMFSLLILSQLGWGCQVVDLEHIQVIIPTHTWIITYIIRSFMLAKKNSERYEIVT